MNATLADPQQASIEALICSVPQVAIVRDAGGERSVPLAELRVGDVVLVRTGDNAVTARAVASALDLDDVRADLMPEDKVTAIAELQKHRFKVAMIGDGINDAPALARADVGIAMGVVHVCGIAAALHVLPGRHRLRYNDPGRIRLRQKPVRDVSVRPVEGTLEHVSAEEIPVATLVLERHVEGTRVNRTTKMEVTHVLHS